MTEPSSASDQSRVFTADFFGRADSMPDSVFYRPTRFVNHIDDAAIEAVSAFYAELGTSGRILDLMSSWVSHLPAKPQHLCVLGLNRDELEANPLADRVVVHDLNEDPALPFEAAEFDLAVCCASVDYLVRPLEVFAQVARALKPSSAFACTFSNRCFPTKAVRGWLHATDEQRCEIVQQYFAMSGAFEPAQVEVRVPPGAGSDPLYAVWARTLSGVDH